MDFMKERSTESQHRDKRGIGLLLTFLALVVFSHSMAETLKAATAIVASLYTVIWIAIIWCVFTLLISTGMWFLMTPSTRPISSRRD